MQPGALENVRRWLHERRPGFSLPQPLYTHPSMYDFDVKAIFERHWIQAGLETQIERPGDYFTMAVGASSIVILRNQDGGVGAFFNACRHRGAQICSGESGHARRLVCPYHQWSYDLNGTLLRAPRMHEGFDVKSVRLRPVAVETVGGVIFVCLSDNPPDFSAFKAALGPMLEPHDLRSAKVVHTVTYVERADWKLVMENARECYHCRAGHPELIQTYSDHTAADVPGRTDEWLAAFDARCKAKGLNTTPIMGEFYEIERFPLSDGVTSYTMDGKPASAKPLGSVGVGGDAGVLWWALQPNGFNHVVGDYAFFFQALPTGPQETTVTGKWIVHKDAEEGVDYDLPRLLQVWDATNLQDRALSENNQRGVNSLAYEPGPYSQVSEQLLMRWVDWYCAQAERFVAEG